MAKYHFDKLELLDHLIRRKATGNPKDLSKKLGVSERTIYSYIELLKILGAPICYCRTRESYFYEYEGQFNFKFISR